MDWWNELTTLGQVFYTAAAFFSVIFIWQLIAAVIGLGGDEADAGDVEAEVDAQMDADVDAGAGEAIEGSGSVYEVHADGGVDTGQMETAAIDATGAFKLLSIRAIITFFTLFAWGTALYLTPPGKLPAWQAIGLGMVWGVVGMVVVAFIFYGMRRLTETGNAHIRSCVGTRGTVYLDIPSGGRGEVRLTLGGRLTHLKARCVDDSPLKAGTPVKVVRALDLSTVEVGPVPKESSNEKE